MRMKISHVNDLTYFTPQVIADTRGMLTVVEAKTLPWEILRTYFISGMGPEHGRGGHAHKRLKQLYLAITGEWKIVFNDGTDERVINLNKHNQAVLIPPGLWREIFTSDKDAVLAVLASDPYDESEYIRSFTDYLDWMRNIGQESRHD